MKISFEAVPRDKDSLQKQIEFVESSLSMVDTINVPDLLRMPIRSWQASTYVDRQRYDFIPHFRAIDFDLKTSLVQDIIQQNKLDRILLISGDPPPNMAHQVYDTNVLDFIEYVRKHFPDMVIYAGFDPYRASIKDERNYMTQKLDAGVDYLLSQPFFDFRLLEIYGELVSPQSIFWGVSPVVSEKSQSYWQRVNNAVFPKSYQATYEWNIQFAIDVLSYAKKQEANIYFMPIGIKLSEYFSPIVKAWT